MELKHPLHQIKQTSVFIDDQGMSQVLKFFEGEAAQPVFTAEQVKRVQDIVESANENKISLLWSKAGLKKNIIILNNMALMV